MITFDASGALRIAKWIDGVADQLPYALSRTVNEAAKAGLKTVAEETWPSHVNVRNKSFMRFAFSRTKFSTKSDLTVEINDERLWQEGRSVGLNLHDKGGVRRARGDSLAIPSREIKARRGSKGVPKNLRPRGLRNTFRKGDVIYQRVGKYQKAAKSIGPRLPGAKRFDGRRLKLMYVLKKAVPIKPDVPFTRDVQRVMRAEMQRQFPIQLREAMRTARR